MNVGVEATNQISGAVCVEETDILVNERVVKVIAEITGDTLAQNVKDCCADTNTDSGDLSKGKRILDLSQPQLTNKKQETYNYNDYHVPARFSDSLKVLLVEHIDAKSNPLGYSQVTQI